MRHRKRVFAYNGVEYSYDPRDMQIIRTHWLVPNAYLYARARPKEAYEIEYRKHYKEHAAACAEFEAKNWERLHPHYAPVGNFTSEDAIHADARAYRLDTTYLLVPTRWQRLKRRVSLGRWT